MLPNLENMSSYDDEVKSDEELPCVTLSQSTGSKSELEMPPASEIASLRAREEAAERALQDLKDFSKDPLLISLSRSASQGSSGEEGEAALSAAVSALQVTEPPGARSTRDHLQLLTALSENLSEDSAFLNQYIHVLTERPEKVDTVTEHLLRGITSALISGKAPSDPGVCLWLLCVSLRGPRGLRARRALHALLDRDGRHVRAFAVSISAAMEEPEQLLSAYDAIRSGARRGADQLAASILAHAMARVLPKQDTPPDAEPPAPLSPATVELVRVSWRRLPPRAHLALLLVAGRALAAAGHTERMTDDTDSDTKPMEGTEDTKTSENVEDKTKCTEDTRAAERECGAALLEALAQPLPRASAFHVDRQHVLTNVSKLQLLFRSRFVSNSDEYPLVEEYFNCSQTSVDSMDTPLKLDTPIKEDSPSKLVTPMKNVKPMNLEMKVKIPMNLVAPMKLDYDLVMNSQANKTPVKIETPIQIDSPIKPELETPVKMTQSETAKMNGAIGTPVRTRSQTDKNVSIAPIKGVKIETQLKIDGFFKQVTPVKVEKDEERSPDRKRVRREHVRERRYPQRSGKS